MRARNEYNKTRIKELEKESQDLAEKANKRSARSSQRENATRMRREIEYLLNGARTAHYRTEILESIS